MPVPHWARRENTPLSFSRWVTPPPPPPPSSSNSLPLSVLQQRKERREKLQALQQRKKDEEEQARKEAAEAAEAAAAAAAAAAASAENGVGDTANGEALRAGNRQSLPSNGEPATDNATSMLSNSVVDDGEEDADDDAGPIEITKQAPGSDDGSNEGGQEEDGNDDESGARNDAPIPGEGRGNGKPANGSSRTGAGGGLSSSELRAQRGKEDRPVFDMFSAASPSAAAAGAGPGGKMGGKGGGHGMSYLGDDGGGDQVGGAVFCQIWETRSAVSF